MELDRPGRFRAQPTVVGLLPGKESQSVAAVFDFDILEMWDDAAGAWTLWAQYEMRIRGFPNLIKANGDPNTYTVESLVKSMGWSGNVEELVEGTGWVPKPCQITVESETFNQQTRLKVNWINEWDSAGGGGLKVVDALGVKALAARYGAKLRAITGNLARNAPKAPVGPPPIPQSTNVFNPEAPDDIPFDSAAGATT